MSFESWIKKFKKQDNVFGDLARDFIDSNCETVEQSFDKYPPCKEALKTYHEAKNNFLIELINDLIDSLEKYVDYDDSSENIEMIEELSNFKTKLINR